MMRPLSVVAGMLALGAAAAVHADGGPALSVDDFLARWGEIKSIGKIKDQRPEAAKQSFSLMQVIADSFGHYKAQLAEDKRMGKPPRACPAKGSSVKFEVDELAAYFSTLPPAQRHGPVEPALFTFLDKKLPCASV